jgi:hypothetical protein
MTTFKLSPSDLTFLWDECPRCFYLKAVRGFGRPAGAFPKVFTRIDGLMKQHFGGLPTQSISLLLPPGVVRKGESWVESLPIEPEGHFARAYLKGKYDTLLEFDDGSFGVVDFKTSDVKTENIPFYSRQLHAYAYALEHAAPRALALGPITQLGLLVVEPDEMRVVDGKIAYMGRVEWQPCPLDMGGFLAFIGQVLDVLAQPEPPAPGAGCAFCAYRDDARQTGY